MPRPALVLLVLALSACRLPAPERVRPEPIRVMSFVADSVREARPLHRAHWGVSIYEPTRARYLYDSEAHRNFIPASVTKLVVTAVSMAELGPDFRWRTELLAHEEEDDPAGVRVVVAARGDPTLSFRYHPDDFAPLDSLADSLRLGGITHVRELVIDAGYFTDGNRHPVWELGDLDWYYGTGVAAFAIAEGAFTFIVEPGLAVGEPARATALVPPQGVLVQTAFTTDSAGAPRRLRVERAVGSDTLLVWGSIALGAPPDTTRLAVGDPARYAAHALAWRMRLRGVAVDDVRVALPGEGAEAEARAAGARTAVAWASPPLHEVIAGILGPSQNFMAEQLLKTLGAERAGDGSWAGGIEVETRYLRDVVGIDTLAFRLSDGSGRSVQNLLAPLAVVRLLEHATTTQWGAAWRAALPGPGQRETTLANRLPGLEGRVRAKTGTITNVATLAGYITTFDGRELIFAIITNGTGVSAVPVRRGIDAIVQAAAREAR